jgi:hypothetical protein
MAEPNWSNAGPVYSQGQKSFALKDFPIYLIYRRTVNCKIAFQYFCFLTVIYMLVPCYIIKK